MKIKIKDIHINYKIKGKGYPVFCLHGYGLDNRVMYGCLEPVFSKKNKHWKRIYLDLPGMGKSEVNSQIKTADDMLEVLMLFIERLLPDNKFIICSESYGCYLTRGLIHKIGERIDGILMICPCLVPNIEKRTLPKPKIIEEDKKLINKLAQNEKEHFSQYTTIRTTKTWNTYKKFVFPERVLNQNFLDQYKKNGYALSFDTELNIMFTKPSLILTGRQDSTVGYKDSFNILDYFPRASYIVLDKAAHMMQIEQKKLFEKAMKEWLKRVKNLYS